MWIYVRHLACNCPYGHVRFDKYTNMKLIASHGGGYLPFIHGRLDVFFNVETLVKFDLPKNRPSIWSKFIMTQSSMIRALDLVIDIAGPDKVMFGTDQPMPHDVPKLRDIIGTRTETSNLQS